MCWVLDFSCMVEANVVKYLICAVKIVKMGETVFTASLEGMKNVKSEQGEMLTRPFLDVCKLLLPILGVFF